jgi:hypothetical protein
MKKILIAVTLGLILGLSVSSFAASGTNTNPGDVLTIEDTNGNGSDFTFTPSPNVYIGYNIATDGSANAINTLNDVTTLENGMEYGTCSDSTGYYQRQKTEADFAAPSDFDIDAFTEWYYVGGGEGGSGGDDNDT